MPAFKFCLTRYEVTNTTFQSTTRHPRLGGRYPRLGGRHPRLGGKVEEKNRPKNMKIYYCGVVVGLNLAQKSLLLR